MSPTPDRFGEYLVGSERLTAVYAGVLRERSGRRPVAIGVTDRRLLCLAEDGTFVNLGYDSVAAIQSRPNSTVSLRGNDYRLLLGIGCLVALVAFAAVVALASNAFVPGFVLATVAGIAAGEHVRWHRTDADPPWPSAVTDRIDGVVERCDAPWRYADRADEFPDDRVVRIASGLVAAGSFVGAIVSASSVVTVLCFFLSLAGLALCDYAHRHRDELDGIELRRRREREVNVSTDDGRSVRIRSDPSDRIGRELSRLAFVEDGDPVGPVAPRS